MPFDAINVNGSFYDPYQILEITHDDTDEAIAKAFRRKARKYHPDKAPHHKKQKYEVCFMILLQSYEYIKSKRVDGKRYIPSQSSNLQSQSDNLRRQPDTQFKKANDIVYEKGDRILPESSRIQTINEYEKFKPTYVNQFSDTKYNSKTFNNIFEYNKHAHQKQHNTDQNETKTLIHRSTDGFYGYNTSDLYGALVSSYNGLLITHDVDELGGGYYNTNYGDFQHTFDAPKNPQTKVKVPKQFVVRQQETNNPPSNESKLKYSPNEQIDTDIESCKDTLLKLQVTDLQNDCKSNKRIILKNLHMFDETTSSKALNGELDACPTLLNYYPKSITEGNERNRR